MSTKKRRPPGIEKSLKNRTTDQEGRVDMSLSPRRLVLTSAGVRVEFQPCCGWRVPPVCRELFSGAATPAKKTGKMWDLFLTGPQQEGITVIPSFCLNFYQRPAPFSVSFRVSEGGQCSQSNVDSPYQISISPQEQAVAFEPLSDGTRRNGVQTVCDDGHEHEQTPKGQQLDGRCVL
jgi:hypothetical protein